MDHDPLKFEQYQQTYFDFISVDSGLIKNHESDIETVNIMRVNFEETDNDIDKYSKSTQDHVPTLSRNIFCFAFITLSSFYCDSSTRPSRSSKTTSK